MWILKHFIFFILKYYYLNANSQAAFLKAQNKVYKLILIFLKGITRIYHHCNIQTSRYLFPDIDESQMRKTRIQKRRCKFGIIISNSQAF